MKITLARKDYDGSALVLEDRLLRIDKDATTGKYSFAKHAEIDSQRIRNPELEGLLVHEQTYEPLKQNVIGSGNSGADIQPINAGNTAVD